MAWQTINLIMVRELQKKSKCWVTCRWALYASMALRSWALPNCKASINLFCPNFAASKWSGLQPGVFPITMFASAHVMPFPNKVKRFGPIFKHVYSSSRFSVCGSTFKACRIANWFALMPCMPLSIN